MWDTIQVSLFEVSSFHHATFAFTLLIPIYPTPVDLNSQPQVLGYIQTVHF